MTDEEINRAIAEKVMGWTVQFAPKELVHWYCGEKGPVHYLGGWHPTSDIAQAWQVVERFPWPQNWVKLQHTSSGNWRCDIELNGGDGPVRSAYAATVPLAICLAALRAMGVEVQA